MKNNFAKYYNRAIAMGHDMVMVVAAWFGAFMLRATDPSTIPEKFYVTAMDVLPIIFCLQVSVFIAFGLYRGVWRFASIPDLVRIIKAVFIASASSLLVLYFAGKLAEVPRSIFPLYAILLIMFCGAGRLSYRYLKERKSYKTHSSQRTLIVGAGGAGEGLVRDLLRHSAQNYQPVGFVDDNIIKIGREIHGIRVLGVIKDLPELIKNYAIDMIIIAIPSIDAKEMRKIVSLCENCAIPFFTLPGIADLTSGKVTVNALREVSIEDLLGRSQINLNWQAISDNIENTSVLVTGGGGSIGSELCRLIAGCQPRDLIIVDNCEFHLYNITKELNEKFPQLIVKDFLVDVSDSLAMEQVFARCRPEFIFHAAAYKHVPLLEEKFRVAVKNNIIGTQIVAELAVKYQANTFVLISTDKAVNPTNLMGTTKRVAEIFCQNLNEQTRVKFITVRFGNVLGSRGSVIPLFRQQIEAGGPVTVTHPDIERFFMTINEASQLILQAAILGKGGEIFVLDMGEPIKIVYLAEQMIILSGRKPYDDIKIEFVGLRPGEKLYEELFHEKEPLDKTEFPKLLLARSRQHDWQFIHQCIIQLNLAVADFNEQEMMSTLSQLVPEYEAKNRAKETVA